MPVCVCTRICTCVCVYMCLCGGVVEHYKYCIAGKFGEGFSLVIWKFKKKSPN